MFFLPGIWWLGFGGHHTKLGSSARLLCIGKSQNLNISSLFFIWNMGLIKYLYSNIGVADSSSHFLPFSARASHCTTWYTTTLIQKSKNQLTPGCMGTPSLQRLCSCSLWSKLYLNLTKTLSFYLISWKSSSLSTSSKGLIRKCRL